MKPNIPLRVRNLIKKHDTCDPYLIAKEMNITILLAQTPSKVNGFWRRILRRKYICINEELCEWQQKAVLCHELGHILLHPGYKNYCMAGRTYVVSQRHEDEADIFALECFSHFSDLDRQYIDDFLKNGWKKQKTTKSRFIL